MSPRAYVCGFDDTEFSRSILPELTTIRQPIADMSKAAMLLLLKKIKARREGRNEDCNTPCSSSPWCAGIRTVRPPALKFPVPLNFPWNPRA